ncbi:uncharacterized protein ACRADG_008653 isoform 1-T2 [Cochliomyia hominivorax]
MFKIKSNYSNLSVNVIIVLLMCKYVLSTPMLYKRNPDDKFERDLVPVSSTVIPLTVLEVSYGLGGKPSEEYKEAYLKKLRKKVKHEQDGSETYGDPDTLITIKKIHSDVNDKAKVKGILTTSQSTESESKN